jgi:hypothetical protein
MNCPDLRILEKLSSGKASLEEQQILDQHLPRCVNCQQEHALNLALRFAASKPIEALEDHLSDEVLAALADEALAPEQLAQARAHLMACETCLSSYAALERAISEVAGGEQAPPIHVLNQAIRIGAPKRSASASENSEAARTTEGSRPGLLDRLFGASLPWRLGVAGSAAGLVLLLTVLVSTSGPKMDEPRPASMHLDEPGRVAMADPGTDKRDHADPATGPAGPEARADPPAGAAPLVAKGTGKALEPETPLPPTDARAPKARNPELTAQDAAQDWVASLDHQLAAGLAERVRPKATLPKAGLGTALATPDHQPAFADGYILGRALGFLERFGPQLERSSELRKTVADTLVSLEPALRTTLASGEQADRLVAFANTLGGKLATDGIAADAAGRRLKVFTQAVREAVKARKSIHGGVRLGVLVQGWQNKAGAEQLGLDVPLQDAAAIKRARRVIRNDPGLSDAMRQSVMRDLGQIEKLARKTRGQKRAGRILEEIGQMDKGIRSSR